MKLNSRQGSIMLLVAVLAAPAAAQELEDIARAYRDDRDALQSYTWKSKVEYTVEGEVTATEMYDVVVGSDGKLERTLLTTDQEGKTKKPQLQAGWTLQSVRELIDAYTDMTPDNFQIIFGGSAVLVGSGEEAGLKRISSSGILHQGDQMTVWLDGNDNSMRRFEIKTMMQKEPVVLRAEFKDLEDGTTYVARSVFEVLQGKKKQTKQVVIVTENFDHRRRAG